MYVDVDEFLCVCKMNNAVKDLTKQKSMHAFLPILLGKLFGNDKLYLSLVYFFIATVFLSLSLSPPLSLNLGVDNCIF